MTEKKITVINGVTGSIGSELARQICQCGGSVIGIGRDASKLSILHAELTDFIPYAISDVSEPSEALAFQRTYLPGYQKRIISYIHLAGILKRETDPLTQHLELWNDTIATNLTGTYIWNKIFIDYFLKLGIPGSIVNTSSQAAYTGGFGPNVSYAASKGGVISLTKSFSRYAAQFNVRVNVVVPGFVENEMMLGSLSQTQKEFFEQKTSVKRFATDLEIAKACMYLSSEESSYSTGIVLDVSGGLLDV